MEYDSCKNLLSVNSKGIQRGVMLLMEQMKSSISFKIMIPVCKPIIAVLALWSFVGMWNSYFDAMIYLNDANLQPLQLVLRSILVQNTPQPGMIADIQSTAEMAKVAEQLKYATIVVSSLPLVSYVSIFPEIL